VDENGVLGQRAAETGKTSCCTTAIHPPTPSFKIVSRGGQRMHLSDVGASGGEWQRGKTHFFSPISDDMTRVAAHARTCSSSSQPLAYKLPMMSLDAAPPRRDHLVPNSPPPPPPIPPPIPPPHQTNDPWQQAQPGSSRPQLSKTSAAAWTS
jgi:hypothetical protein